MLDLFLNFFRALADAIPKLYELYRDNQQEEKIVELLESYFILGDLIYSAEELLLIVRNKDKVVTRTMLLEGVWDYHFDPQTNVIDVHISRLRKKLGEASDKTIIETVRGAGYIIQSS